MLRKYARIIVLCQYDLDLSEPFSVQGRCGQHDYNNAYYLDAHKKITAERII